MAAWQHGEECQKIKVARGGAVQAGRMTIPYPRSKGLLEPVRKLYQPVLPSDVQTEDGVTVVMPVHLADAMTSSALRVSAVEQRGSGCRTEKTLCSIPRTTPRSDSDAQRIRFNAFFAWTVD